MGAGLLPLLTVALLAVTGCGLLGGGGLSDEEILALQTQVSTTKQMLDEVDRDNSAKQVRIAELESEINAVLSQAAETASEGKISLESARLKVVRFAQDNLDAYGPFFGAMRLVWVVESSEEDEEFYYIRLTYRPFQTSTGTAGTEEFITDKTGKIEFRQVLTEPTDKEPEPEPPPEGG